MHTFNKPLATVFHYFRFTAFVFAASLISTSANAAIQAEPDETLLIRHVQIVSGSSGKTSKAQDVLIKGNRIAKIGRKLKSHGRVIDAKGKFLIPGLIDTHVHLEGIPGYKDDGSMDAALVAKTLKQIPRNYLYFGFTTLLDLAGNASFINEWNASELAPQALRCSPVTIPNGYPLSWLDEHEQFHVPNAKYMLFDQSQAQVYPADFLKDQHSPAAIARSIKADGASCVKVFYEKGFGPKKNLPVPEVNLIKALVKHAHELDLPVYLHGNSQASYEFALATGVDTVVHGMWHWDSFQQAGIVELENFAQDFAKSKIAIQPTIQVLRGELDLFNPDYFKDPRVQQTMSPELIQWFQSEAGQWMLEIMRKQMPPQLNNDALAAYNAVKEQYQTPISQVNRMSRMLAQHGTTLLFGSDTPSGPFYTQYPGINGRLEMDRWIDAGLTLQQLFEGLTINNAKNLGLDKRIGLVKEGFQADLLLLDANPLESSEAYDTIELIIVNGKPVERSDLSARAQ